VLARHPRVAQASVVARTDETGTTRLVAYVAPVMHEERRDLEAATLTDVLKVYAAEHLPEHLRPSLTVELPRLPLNHHGKLDREALPDPYRPTVLDEAAASASGPPFRTTTERAVAALWAENLGLPGVRRHDNYFDLGGDSIAVTRMIVQVRRQFGIKLSMRDVMNAADLSAFCSAIDRAQLIEESC
jgi:acyl carrier protein